MRCGPSWRHYCELSKPATTDLRTKTWSKSLPMDHNNKKGAVWEKFSSWVDTMVGIILVSRSNASQGENNLAQWCLTYFVVPNKTRISKQAEGTLSSLPWEWEECWEWTDVELGEKIQECVYVMVQLWTSMKHLCQKFPRWMPKALWKQSLTVKSAGDLVQ